MKKILILSLFLCSCVLFSQNLTKEQLKQDLDTFKIKLPLKHKNLFAKISKEDFEKNIGKLEKKLGNLSKEEFEIELAKIIKKVGDEHTIVVPNFTNLFPLEVAFFKEGIFYTTKNSNGLTYGKVKKIGKNSTNSVLRKFKTVIQNENEYYFQSMFQSFVKIPNYLKGLNINEDLTKLNLEFGNQKIMLNSIPRKEYVPIRNTNLLRYSKNNNYWFDYQKDKKLLYINYSKCNEIKDYPFSQFSDDVFKVINTQEISKIVIDLRDNGGGNSAIIKPLLEKLKTSKLNNENSLYVLIGKITFSSALMNAITLKKDFKSTLVGEPTSGNINHYGEVKGIQLPNTKAIIQFSTKYWENWKGKEGPLKPDVFIEYSFENYKNNIDEALEYVYRK